MSCYRDNYDAIVASHKLGSTSNEECEMDIALLMNDMEERFPNNFKEKLEEFGIIEDKSKYTVYNPFK